MNETHRRGHWVTRKVLSHCAALVLLLVLSLGSTRALAQYSENFASGATGWSAVSGSWSLAGGTYNDTSAGGDDIALYSSATWGTDYTLKADMRNPYGGAIHRTGLIYNYVDGSNYYRVRFDSDGPPGIATITKFVGGVETSSTASFSGGGSGVWFTVEVVRTGGTTAVKVNGTTIFSGVSQGDLGAGKIGFYTRWSPGEFDNVSVTTSGDTQPPTTPGGLTATAISGSQINLAWTASTDNVGVTSYLLERCAGSGCTNFAQIGSSVTASFSNTGLAATTTYRYQVRATDAAGNLSGYSSIGTATTSGGADTQPPTAPSNLTGTAASSTQINLAWSAATDNVGVTSYLVERCTGTGCTNFSQVASTTATSLNNTGLTASTTYVYRVRATDAAGNLGPYSGSASAATSGSGGGGGVAYSENFNNGGPAGWSVVAGNWAIAQNQYYYASSVAADDLALYNSATWSTDYTLKVDIYNEYGNTGNRGGIVYNYVDANNYYRVDFSGNGAPSLGRLTKVINGTPTSTDQTFTGGASGSWITVEVIRAGTTTTVKVNGTTVFSNVTQSELGAGKIGFAKSWTPSWYDNVSVTTAGGGGGGGDTQAPTAPSGLSASASGTGQINLSWTAATDNVGVTAHLIERCTGASCTVFAQTASVTAPGVTYSDTGLSPGQSYSYRVRATDAADNLGPYAATVTASTAANPGLAGTIRYTYDEATRLKRVVFADDTATDYALDAAGNRKNVTTALPPNPGVLQWSAPTYIGAEGGGTVAILATRTGGATGAVSASYSLSGTATNGTDYSASGSLSWAAGDSGAKTLTVTIVDDVAVDPGETATFTMTGPTGGAALGALAATTLTINDNDSPPPPGTLQLGATSYTVAENGASVTITVTRTGGSNGAASINYATSNGTATAGSDYTSTSGTLTWTSGDAVAKTFQVPILDDASAESSETVSVNLSGATGATAGTPSAATVTITDHEPGTVSFSPADYAVTEANTTVTVTVTRSVGSVGAVTVNYATSDGSASAGGDYTSTSGTLSWAAGETANKTFAVPILNDALIESAETINLTLSSVTGGAVIGISAGTITINPDDDTPPTIPTNLAGTPSGAAVNLGWTASTDNVGVAGYRIFRNGVQIGTSTTTTYSDSTGLAGTTTYSYFVDAYDAANNVSGFTSPINVTTSDWEPPTVPQGLSATAVSASQINLSWTASTDSGGAGLSRYRVWRGTTLVSDFSAATTFSDVLLSASTTYSYTVAAVDNAGNQSAASASASATTFAPPPDPPGTPSWTNGWGLCGGACITYSGSEVLTWQVTSGGTASYYEQQSSNGAGSWQTDQTTTNPEAAVGIPLAQIRRFRVRACNVAGCSPYSSDIGIYYDPNP